MNMKISDKAQYRRLYKNHSPSIGYWEGWVDYTGVVVMQYAKTLDGKVVRKEYQAKAKNLGRSNATTAFTQACLELESRTNKQRDKGYVDTQEAAGAPSTNTLGFAKPMLATPLDKVKPEKIDWEQAYCQPKLDGHRALYKDGVLYSRQGKELDIPHIVKAIKACGLEHLHLDGELYIHGYTLQELSSLIKRDQLGSEHLEYHIYDCVEEAPFNTRIVRLVTHFMGENISPCLRPVQTTVVENMEEVTALHAEYRKAHYEGTMLRFGDSHYQDGKRSRSLLKIKEFHDAEFTIVDVKEGKPYISDGWKWEVPIWVLDAGNGETFTAIAQGNMQQKDALWNRREDCIGKQLTVKYHYLSPLGIPQLPVALRFREDI